MLKIDKKKCTGCGCCAVVCPVKCIDIKEDDDGFYKPIMTSPAKCVNCGLCNRICPSNVSESSIIPIGTFSLVSKDKHVLETTSSGGACFEIAKKALEQGYKVCACVYDYRDNLAKHVIINNQLDLENTKGSKYIQSYTKNSFSNLFNGEKWCVIGTPCQIAAISKIAEVKKCRDRFLLIDFFCHGTPSMLLWRKYIKDKKKSISKIDFRSKEFGWHSFSLKFHFNDGSVESDQKKNMFYSFFFNHTCLNEACFDCSYKALNSFADIRVGDFWGTKYASNNSGVSSVVVFSRFGEGVIKALELTCNIEHAEIDDILETQMKTSPHRPEIRNVIISSLRTRIPLFIIRNTVLMPYRIKEKILSIMKGRP